ncbi:hypothetical protein COLO4_33779 [Corchorus olitorius]|uniref:Uncharacterized protein n=1 Tax=Corchorus olitorius TaxID=93759 RepID=A0A1R3GRE4_9ROSI|nr:hypothetical protein COLO4_33779 [Corchorus olitorius]
MIGKFWSLTPSTQKLLYYSRLFEKFSTDESLEQKEEEKENQSVLYVDFGGKAVQLLAIYTCALESRRTLME